MARLKEKRKGSIKVVGSRATRRKKAGTGTIWVAVGHSNFVRVKHNPNSRFPPKAKIKTCIYVHFRMTGFESNLSYDVWEVNYTINYKLYDFYSSWYNYLYCYRLKVYSGLKSPSSISTLLDTIFQYIIFLVYCRRSRRIRRSHEGLG
jgi:hypothetical protein